jgi:protein-disulfide isomerase
VGDRQAKPDTVGCTLGEITHVKRRILAAALAALVLAATPACAQSSEVEALRREIEALKEDLANLRASIGRPRPIVDLNGAPQKGNPEAIVALVEFSDYECPFCIRHFRETMPLIQKNYIETGKILYAFRDFPIDQLHPQAIRAHEAAQCVNELQPAKFWDMHDRMFGAPAQHSLEALEATATQLGTDGAKYRECIASGRTTPGIRKTADLASSFGANGTPAFFIGIIDKATNQVKITRSISGAVPFAQFAQAIEAAIAQGTAK